jgi:hypothetical protein
VRHPRERALPERALQAQQPAQALRRQALPERALQAQALQAQVSALRA